MIPQHLNEGDLVSIAPVIAECPAASNTMSFNFTLMDVAAEVVVTTEPNFEPGCQCETWSVCQACRSACLPLTQQTSRSSLKRPTSLPLDHKVKHTHNKITLRDLSIFNSEEPHIVGYSKKSMCSIDKSFDFTTCEMEVAAQEEVTTECTYITPVVESDQTIVASKSKSDLAEDNNLISIESLTDSAFSSDRHSSLEDSFKASLPMTPDTEKALVTFARFGDSDILLPIVKRDPGFDLIDFINNDFRSAEDMSSPRNLKEKSEYCWPNHKNCKKTI